MGTRPKAERIQRGFGQGPLWHLYKEDMSKMNRLEKLRQELSTMSQDEVLEFIRRTRIDRRITKERPSVKRAKRVTADKTKAKAKKALGGLSPAALERLLKEFGGSDEDSGSGSCKDKG